MRLSTRPIAAALLALFALSACGDDAAEGTERDASADSGSSADSSSDTGSDRDDAAASIDTTPDDVATPDTSVPDVVDLDTPVPDAADDVAIVTDTGADDVAVPDTTASAGACDNEADTAVLAGAEDLEGIIGNCAFSCISTGAPCATECVQRDVGTSAECSACFGAVIGCTLTNCALQCLDAGSAGCTTCRDTNCTPAFEECAGIAQP
jgi:hypothetical protein